jgi:hypothetical protein
VTVPVPKALATLPAKVPALMAMPPEKGIHAREEQRACSLLADAEADPAHDSGQRELRSSDADGAVRAERRPFPNDCSFRCSSRSCRRSP